jgi:hypothetical protein
MERKSCSCLHLFAWFADRGFWPVAAGGALMVSAARAAAPAEFDPSKLPPPAQVQIVFSRDIKPILSNTCYRCHAGEKPKSHFVLTTRETALKGGDAGVDILPGQSAKSPLIYYVSRLVPEMEMPPEGKGTPLTSEQVGLLRAWIDQGVAWEQTEPEKKTELTISPTVGWTTVNGDQRKFRELYWQHEGWNGGGEFSLTNNPTPDTKITTAGHVLLNDYKLTLSAEKSDSTWTPAAPGWTSAWPCRTGRGWCWVTNINIGMARNPAPNGGRSVMGVRHAISIPLTRT